MTIEEIAEELNKLEERKKINNNIRQLMEKTIKECGIVLTAVEGIEETWQIVKE